MIEDDAIILNSRDAFPLLFATCRSCETFAVILDAK
jgi:hypothetical protein